MSTNFILADACNNFTDHITKIMQKTRTDAKYVVNKHNKKIIEDLVKYFCDQPGSLDPNKGIYLMGPPGTGKTTLMRAFSTWPSNTKKFRIANCRDIQKEAAKKSFEALEIYTKNSYHFKNGFHHRDNGYIVYCFDDFGAEKVTKFYGTEINVMEEMIQDRWNEMDLTGMITHMTSNLKGHGDNVKEIYGIRVHDRLRQMCNFIELDGPSHR